MAMQPFQQSVSYSAQGRIVSYYFNGQQLERHSALKAHPENEGPVHQFLFNERGVISLAARSVHSMNRRALTQWHIEFVPLVLGKFLFAEIMTGKTT